MEILLFFIASVLIIFGIAALVLEESSGFILIVAALILFLFANAISEEKSYTRTIKRSSDSGWEDSDKQMPDTVITTKFITTKGDTVYQSIEYLNIKIN